MLTAPPGASEGRRVDRPHVGSRRADAGGTLRGLAPGQFSDGVGRDNPYNP